MTRSSLDREARVAVIARILREEGLAEWLHYEFSVTVEKEAEVLDVVCQKDQDVDSIVGLLMGMADGASPADLKRAAQRILDETK
jgi:hypothetical protein